MRLIADIMSGDKAPREMLIGALDAAQERSAKIVLVGDERVICQTAEENGRALAGVEIVHAPEVIGMEDDPILSIRQKKDSSLVRGLRLLAAGEGDAFVSAGNTGALFTGATVFVRRLKGLDRAAIGPVLPGKQPCLLVDGGANVSVSDVHLEQFAVMGSAYMRSVFGIERPTVGLLNNGTERCKGTPLQVSAYERLSACEKIEFVGNVEAGAVPFGACDVLVTDGFTGNILLKSLEGVGKLLLGSVKELLLNGNTGEDLLGQFRSLAGVFDPAEHGGAPILGLNKPVIKAHGSSGARAFKNALAQAQRYASSGVIADLAAAAEQESKLSI